jgi:DNA (cytosine-5)-methyltransferase 1
VFVVASARDDFDPAAVLFEFNGVRRDTAPSREARQETAASARAGVEFGGMSPVAGTLTANTGGMTRPAGNANELDFCVPVAQPLGFSGRGDGSDALEGITPTMRSLAQGTDGHQSGSAGLAVAQPIAIQDVRPIEKMQNGRGWNDDGTAYTVDTHATQGVAQPIGIFQDSEYGVAKYDSAGTLRAGRIPEHQMVMQPMPINTMVALRHEALGEGTGFGIGAAGDPAYTLTKGHSHAVAHPVGFDAYNNDVTGDVSKTIDTGQDYHHVPNVMVSQPVVAPTLTASNDPSRSPQSTEVTNQVASVYEASMAVRRLTPVECERLQGFPDGYTNIPWRKKPESPDGPRYKALGNSWAVPVVAWLGKRINEAVK